MDAQHRVARAAALARGPRPVDGQGATSVGHLGPLTRKGMQYQDLMKQFVPTAWGAQDWASRANSYRLPLRTHRKVPFSPRLVPIYGDAQSVGTLNRHFRDHGQAHFRAARPRALRNCRATHRKPRAQIMNSMSSTLTRSSPPHSTTCKSAGKGAAGALSQLGKVRITASPLRFGEPQCHGNKSAE
jgi:hypothetical protein